jgi:hypothetical protein
LVHISAAAPLLMPHDDVAICRPITPLRGGHVGLLCTAGLLNGVFGDGENRHIARWRSVKHVTTFVEEDGDAEIIHHRERWTNDSAWPMPMGECSSLLRPPRRRRAKTMENAHLRLGLLEYVRITEKASTRIRLRVDRYIGEDRQAYLCQGSKSSTWCSSVSSTSR